MFSDHQNSNNDYKFLLVHNRINGLILAIDKILTESAVEEKKVESKEEDDDVPLTLGRRGK